MVHTRANQGRLSGAGLCTLQLAGTFVSSFETLTATHTYTRTNYTASCARA